MVDASKDMLERYEKGLAQEEELFLQLEQWFDNTFDKNEEGYEKLYDEFNLSPIEFYHEWRD